MPADASGAPAGSAPGADQSGQPAANRPGGGLGNPIDTPDPLNKYKGWILSGLGLVLVVAAGFMLRTRPGQQSAQSVSAPTSPSAALTPTSTGTRVAHPVSPVAANGAFYKSPLLAALKDELFVLETERLEGKISEKEYTELKSAFEVVLRRALARQSVTTH
jgi:hypothetical protein